MMPKPLLIRKQGRRKGGCSLTVCVAAIFENQGVIGASDRMLTGGDIEFEPPITKVRPLTTSIAAMIAGDSEVQEEILSSVMRDIDERISQRAEWVPVRDVAEFYRKRFWEVARKKSQDEILEPLGLDFQTFISEQRNLAPNLVDKISIELINIKPPSVEAIIAGIDASGPHIYVADGASVRCRDGIGFAAIGAGYWHANSQLMSANVTKNSMLAESLLSIYSAKKRSEVAPGVGEATDMVFIGSLGGYVWVGEHVLRKLEEIHRHSLRRRKINERKAQSEMSQYVEQLFSTPAAKEQSAIPEESVHSREIPADTEDPSVNSQEGDAQDAP